MEQPFMLWLQDNWIVVAVVALIAAVAILWRLLARRRPEEIAPPVVPPTEPAKPLEPAKPDIVAAEPARFKAAEPTAPPPPPAAAPAPVAAAESADNLQLLKGVGPKLAALLTGLGITSFRQIAGWTDTDIAAIDAQLGAFQGRIVRDNLVDQAGYLARGDKAGFEAKYGALGGEL
jgi:predicted flap endonuclease-1-like 5' DNA nuclease